MERSHRLAAESALLGALARLADPQLAALLDEARQMAEGDVLDARAVRVLTPEVNRVVRDACERLSEPVGTTPSQLFSFVQPDCRLPVARFPRASMIRVDRMIGGSIAAVLRPAKRMSFEWPFATPLHAVPTEPRARRNRGIQARGSELIVHAGEVFKAPADSNYYLPSPYLSRLVQHAADAGVLVSAPPRLFVVPTPKALPRITDSHAPHKRPELVLCH